MNSSAVKKHGTCNAGSAAPKRRLKVGFVIDTNLDSNDGVQQYVKRLGGWLSAQGHEIEYLTSDSGIAEWHGSAVHSLASKLTVRFNANRVTMPLWPRQSKIRSLLNRTEYDILHVQAPYSPLLAQRIINQASPRTSVVGTFHILPSSRIQTVGSRLLRIIYGRSLKRFDGFISVSPAAARFASKYYGISSVVIPNPVDIGSFKISAQAKSDNKKIVFLGRLVQRKGAQWLLRAVVRLKSRLDGLEVVIAGDGPMRSELESFVRKSGLSGIVSFTGFIDEADKPSLLASADVACFPAMYGESFGIVLIEAMAAGSGVVLAGDNPGYRSVLGGRPECLVDCRDAEALSERLYSLLTDSQLSDALHCWQQSQLDRYDTAAVGTATLEVYRKAIVKRSNS